MKNLFLIVLCFFLSALSFAQEQTTMELLESKIWKTPLDKSQGDIDGYYSIYSNKNHEKD